MLAIIPLPWRIVAMLAMCGICYVIGRVDGSTGARAEQREAQLTQVLDAQRIERKQATVTAQAETRAAQEVEKVRTVYRDVNKEVIRYVSTPNRAVCDLDVGWLRIHDFAATGVPTVSDATRELDATASGFTADDALRAVTENYGIASENAARLRGLQE